MLVTPKQMVCAEQKCNENFVCLKELMHNAASRLSEFIISQNICGKILFLCGKGNNGGDGIVAATILKRAGFFVSIALLCGQPATDLAIDAIDVARQENIEIISDFEHIKSAVTRADALVDCVFGTGFQGVLDESIARIFNINTNAIKISADIPSGANGLTGAADKNTFCADFTLTFGRKKTGLAMYPAKEKCGRVIVCDIGIPDECYEACESFFEIDLQKAKSILPKRKADSHKGDFGRLLCVVGSENMMGAAQLCIDAALRSGAGIVKAAVPTGVKAAIACAVPEALWLCLKTDALGFITRENIDILRKEAQNCDALVIGCGLGISEDIKYIVKSLIENINCPIILDADGINCISGCIDILTGKDNIIITPHPGEAARLLGCSIPQVAADRIDCARQIADKGCVAVLKGAATIVSHKGSFGINTVGNAGMSRGGSGDVLSGIIGALAAQGISPFESALLGVYIHGAAGDIAANQVSQYSCLPRDFILNLSKAFSEVEISEN